MRRRPGSPAPLASWPQGMAAEGQGRPWAVVVMGRWGIPLQAPFYPICTFQEEWKPSKLLDLPPSNEVGVRLRESGSQACGQGSVLWAGP